MSGNRAHLYPISRVAIDQWLQRIDALDLPLAEDPEELRGESWNGEIDLLIVTEHYYEILTGETKRLSPQLMLVGSIVGWLVHGVVGDADRPDQAALMLLVKASQQEIEGAPEEMLKRIFDIDGLGGGKIQDEKDPAEEQFKNSLTTEEGRYCVTLPWKDGHPLLPTYEEAASAQLRSQLRRMKRCPEVLEKYDKQLKDYVEGGFAEIIDPKAESSEGGIVTYILHLEVIRLDKSSTKVRPVFNASFGKPSLNSCLNSGPNLVPPMVEILWDEELPAEMKREFWQWVDQLQDLPAVSVPRWYAENLSKVQESELHVFCDASEKAYGSVAYLRCTEQTRRTEVNIIASRARVAPLDPPT